MNTIGRQVQVHVPGGAIVEGEVVHVGQTVGEFGVQGAEFFAVPCIVVQTKTQLITIPLTQAPNIAPVHLRVHIVQEGSTSD